LLIEDAVQSGKLSAPHHPFFICMCVAEMSCDTFQIFQKSPTNVCEKKVRSYKVNTKNYHNFDKQLGHSFAMESVE